MKQIVVFFLTCFACSAYAQSSFYIGPTVSTGMFWLYNKDDIKGTFTGLDTMFLSPNSPISLKNFNIGIHSTFYPKDRIGIDVAILYQKYNQDYDRYNNFDNLRNYFSHININSQLNYFTLILSPSFNLNDNNNALSFFISPGISYSYLADYTLTRCYTFNILSKSGIMKAYEYGNGSYYSYDENDNLLGESIHTGRYNKNIIGISNRLGARINLSERLILEVSTNAQYIITNTDNINATATNNNGIKYKLWENVGSTIPTLNPRSKSQNIYCGLGLSVVYKFGDSY